MWHRGLTYQEAPQSLEFAPLPPPAQPFPLFDNAALSNNQGAHYNAEDDNHDEINLERHERNRNLLLCVSLNPSEYVYMDRGNGRHTSVSDGKTLMQKIRCQIHMLHPFTGALKE